MQSQPNQFAVLASIICSGDSCPDVLSIALELYTLTTAFAPFKVSAAWTCFFEIAVKCQQQSQGTTRKGSLCLATNKFYDN